MGVITGGAAVDGIVGVEVGGFGVPVTGVVRGGRLLGGVVIMVVGVPVGEG